MSKPKETKATNAPKDPWKELILPAWLKELSDNVITNWEKIEKYPEAHSNSPEVVDEYEERQKIIKGKSNTIVTSSAAKGFVKKSGEVLVEILEDLSSLREITQNNLLGKANTVEHTLEIQELNLIRCLPDFSGKEAYRWPGPIGYRAALNHLISVSIRVHSMYPDISFEEVLGAAVRRIIVPALAHNLSFLRKKHITTFNRLLRDKDNAISQLLTKNQMALTLSNKPSEDDWLFLKWARLLNACYEFSDKLNKKQTSALFEELRELTIEHDVNPMGSKLWAQLSLLATGDLSVDEMLVSRVTSDLKLPQEVKTTKVPLIFCARTRFGLLKYSYAMQEERLLLDTNLKEALKHCRDFRSKCITSGSLNEEDCKRLFGWAYLLSRYALLGQDSKQKVDNPTYRKNALECSEHLIKCLEVIKSDVKKPKPEYELIALRYLAGYLSNPRFIRPQNCIERAKAYVDTMKELLLPKGLISLIEARIHLHDAVLNNNDKSLRESLKHFAQTLASITIKQDAPNNMDGEVAAWGIPEICFSISLLQQHQEDLLRKQKAKYNIISKESSKFIRINKALNVLAEMQFGVFFEFTEERERIDNGIRSINKS
jgi:hypothetical protein